VPSVHTAGGLHEHPQVCTSTISLG
jgi:hypothetical protein